MNPATFLRCLGPSRVEDRIRRAGRSAPTDGRYGENPFRFQHYFQYQVLLKPAPEDVLDLYFASLEAIGIDTKRHDVRLVEDDWEQPTLGAWGLGWEVWCDGHGGDRSSRTSSRWAGSRSSSCRPRSPTASSGLAMFLQGKRSALELGVGARGDAGATSTARTSAQWSVYNFEVAPVEILHAASPTTRRSAATCSSRELPLPAYDQVLKCSHTFNLLDAARRDLGHRARGVHRPRPEPRATRRAALRGEDVPTLLLEIGCEELPAAACAGGGERSFASAGVKLGARPACSSGRARLALLVDELPSASRRVGQGAARAAARQSRRRGLRSKQGVGRRRASMVRDGFLGVARARQAAPRRRCPSA